MVQQKKIRESNMELLRLIAAIFVIFLHANCRIFGSIEGSGVISVLRAIADASTIICVNLFVLITGYFGASLKPKKLLMLIYTLLFSIVPIGIIYMVWSGVSLNEYMERPPLTIWKTWFINAYIGLIFFLPIINAGLVNLTHRMFLALIVVLVFIYGFLDYFFGLYGLSYNYGYSVIWLICLYCLGRYIRKHVTMSLVKAILLFSGGVALQTFLTLNHTNSVYTSPVCVLTSVGFFMMFTHLKFQSKVVNYIAASSLMIILFHMSPVGWGTFKAINYYVAENYAPTISGILIITICLGFAVVGFMYDQLRKLTWRWLSPWADSLSQKVQDWVNNEQLR